MKCVIEIPTRFYVCIMFPNSQIWLPNVSGIFSYKQMLVSLAVFIHTVVFVGV